MKQQRYIVLLLGLFLLCQGWCQAQANVPYQRLLLLIAGPSGERISPDEQGVVSYLNQLRGEYQLYNLQMGTMHYDRPEEAQILKNNLGFDPSVGITVGLVQLSNQGIPVKTLYKEEGVTPQMAAERHRELLTRWSQVSGETIPEALKAVASNTTSPVNGVQDPQTQPPTISSDSSSALPPPQKGPALTPEGIGNTIGLLEQETAALFQDFRNQPVREDRMDLPLRDATLELSQAAQLLRLARDRGLVYPMEELQKVRAAGRAWRLAEPQFYLPVHLRKEVKPMLELLRLIESIEAQGREAG